MTPAHSVLEHALSRPATLGTGRLICVDGPAGSGKTTLAAALAATAAESVASGARVVHMDDLYEGWGGLPHVAPTVHGLLDPLSRGEAGRYRRYDWDAGHHAESVVVEPLPLLVLEGVGSGSRAWEPLITTLVWVEAPHDLRLDRGIARDGESFAVQWAAWAAAEAELFAREHTRDRADLHLDGTTGVLR